MPRIVDHPFKNYLAFTLRSLSDWFDLELAFLDSSGQQAIEKGANIRNRLMHPKTTRDLNIKAKT